jgi:hypothetical protein
MAACAKGIDDEDPRLGGFDLSVGVYHFRVVD